MTAFVLLRQSRRQLVRAAAGADLVAEVWRSSDEHSCHEHRICLANAAKVGLVMLIDGAPDALQVRRYYALTRQITPGAPLRTSWLGPDADERGLPQASCRDVLKTRAEPQAQSAQIQVELREIVGAVND
ncbi:hypothetical protein M446_3981 [Methylobacterium sp. 4-46]|uniref:hypothetical protein n=1 Tax=unclassified Methylobacterium TaxID=2615210 RepID=UPI000152BEFD|nr:MULTISPECIES: hypothetical protein [Methylobacterium]ACA18346.1 hypothetical protein M446_3981 [Methylobacterium sp. 4-46]WFT77642.1 hypothetical protein QA634_20225 [Methylobacterium nodulans]